MEFEPREAIEVLSRTPATLDSWLRGLSDGWISADEGPETWSPVDVVGHLIHCERTDWIPRARIILAGHSGEFEPFDRFGHLEASKGNALDELLDELAEVRHRNLATLEGWQLTPEQLALTGRHPEFGTVTLAELLATWAVHDLGHIAQIARVMAKRYTDLIGPWKAYLPIVAPR